MTEIPHNTPETPRPGMFLVQALIPFTAQGRPLTGEDEHYGFVFDSFLFEAEANDVELPLDRPIGQAHGVQRRFGSIKVQVDAVLLNESSGMMPEDPEIGHVIGEVVCHLYDESGSGENNVGWEYLMYSSGIVRLFHGSPLNDEYFPHFPEKQREYHDALRALGFDQEVDLMEAGGVVSLEDDVEYANDHHIESLLAILQEKGTLT